jgi:Ca2+-binding RTX toxin-like protein
MSANATASDITLANTITADYQTYVDLAALADGGWISTWVTTVGDSSEIHQQRFDASGNGVGAEIEVNTVTAGSQLDPSVSGLSDGGWVVSWSSISNDNGYEINSQRYDSDGNAVGTEVIVHAATAYQGTAFVTGLSDGGYVVAWSSQDFTGFDVLLQRYDADGAATGGETRLSATTTGARGLPTLAPLPDGGYVAVWMSGAQDGDGQGIFQQVYDAAGNPLSGSDTQVNTYTTDRQGDQDIAVLADGGWVVTWESEGQDGTYGGVYMQRYAADGSAFGSETRINETISGDEGNPRIAALADGGWAVVYQCTTNTGIDIRMMRYDADGQPVGEETVVSDPAAYNSQMPDIVALADGGWVISWHGYGADPSSTEILQRHFAPDVDGTSGDDDLSGTVWSESLFGLGGNDTLHGGAGADVLDGGTGNDSMVGGDGNDVYLVDSTGDTVTETAGHGTDTVQASASFTLGAEVEDLTLTGTGDIAGTGNGLANVIEGNSGANSLSGLAGNDTLSGGDGADVLDGGDDNDTLAGDGGADTLIGGAGNDLLDGGTGNDSLAGGADDDIYIVDSAGDQVSEASNAGNDIVYAAVSFTLADNVENLVLTGSDDLSGTGNDGDNQIVGNGGANTLTGGGGSDELFGYGGDDALIGGAGNDVYHVEELGDTVTEGRDGGTDTVIAMCDFTLGANVENLVISCEEDFSGTGNSLANIMTGNDHDNVLSGLGGNDHLYGGLGHDVLNGGVGDDSLDGGDGADSLAGGLGNDIYFVDVAGDRVKEDANSGTDTVHTLVSFTLSDNVERLALKGHANLSGTGNDLDNSLIGNDGANILVGLDGDDWIDGGAGNDTLRGGRGDDVYTLDTRDDVIREIAGQGDDKIRATFTIRLDSYLHVEDVTLIGTGAINAIGNAGSNGLTGNGGANRLAGLGGNDQLVGNGGSDTFVFGRDSDCDTIADFTASGKTTTSSTSPASPSSPISATSRPIT